jgi:hypothetical protein
MAPWLALRPGGAILLADGLQLRGRRVRDALIHGWHG